MYFEPILLLYIIHFNQLIIGWLISDTGSSNIVFYFAGASLILAGLLCCFLRVCSRCTLTSDDNELDSKKKEVASIVA